jgi:hypothetical protein
MVLLVAGALVVALGLFSGIVLTLAPLGLAPWSPELVLWVLFPLFSVVGFLLVAMAGSRRRCAASPSPSRACCCCWRWLQPPGSCCPPPRSSGPSAA